MESDHYLDSYNDESAESDTSSVKDRIEGLVYPENDYSLLFSYPDEQSSDDSTFEGGQNLFDTDSDDTVCCDESVYWVVEDEDDGISVVGWSDHEESSVASNHFPLHNAVRHGDHGQ